MKTRVPRTKGFPVSPKTVAKWRPPTPKAPASSVAHPLFIPLLRVAPEHNIQSMHTNTYNN